MFLKINEMRKCHPHQGFWRSGEIGDFALRGGGKANPRGLTQAVAIRYKDPGPSEPKAVIFRGIYWLQLKSGRFSGNLNAESACPIKDSVLGILRYCLRPSIKHTGEKSEAEGSQVGWDAVRHAKPGAGRHANGRGSAGSLGSTE